MKKPIVGITGNVSKEKSKDTWENGITRTYSSTVFLDIVLKTGGLPIILPIGSEQTVKDYVTMVDKLILTGGQHVSPHFYGEKRSIKSDDYNEDRDVFESQLIMEALKQNKPILAICRGAQLVNVVLGGTLNQSISNHWQEQAPNQAHQSIHVSKDSILFPIYGNSSQVNSLHIQSIKKLAPELKAIAWDNKDQTIEAVYSRKHRLLGLQWHPELLLSTKPENQAIFDFFVNQL
ncbi:gamma-glutamyl-gamma-aminobutyrate hydrolase family protein [Streptococcus porcinus]|uniref:Gamma-glutamyl-gamma-aminobutyrate hydrolase family protein n=2 Tax=Streptococcus porcinus TaxID=1340 RepID=A0A7W0ASC3_STRPO|nr:gamma-glutamyl-gamma-aminobutyrate hydrolase family protein [Streptococcus porcinus]EGJ26866.1 peptidase C26 [Streptococcus porcinus str. Jelinkova 176]MBA2796144.1 gamma-glutamyl-gamma-aminobutyrate hydrolase family protein [Streptococcus porcinus]SQG42887.1 peptidase [Streptococcus porcinus]